jgi:hypothetical protein
LEFDERNPNLNFSVIDGQHRINGAYLAVSLLRQRGKDVSWEIPAEIFLDLARVYRVGGDKNDFALFPT